MIQVGSPVPGRRLRLAGTCLLLAGATQAPAQTREPESLFNLSLTELMDVPILTSARKREDVLLEIPAAVTVLTEQELADFDLRSFDGFAGRIPNLSFAYGNGLTSGNPSTGFSSSRTIALRGLSGPRTTGFYIDDIPLPGSVEVRAADLQSLEVLKGPQGTLFGESSLGGNLRLTPKAPDFQRNEFRYQVQAGRTQGADGANLAAEVVANEVLTPRVALRVLASVADDAGFLTRTWPSAPRGSSDDQGAQRTALTSVTALMRATDDLDVSLRFLAQDLRVTGFPATWAPLPGFRPVFTMDRAADLQPRADDTWTLPSLALTWRGPGLTLTSTTSLFNRHTRDLEDATEGTLQIYAGALPAQPFLWTSRFRDRQFAHETRAAFDETGRWSGTLGVFFSRRTSSYAIPPVYGRLPDGSTSLLWVQSDENTQQDLAFFGEAYCKFQNGFTLTAGARQYWLRQSDEQQVLIGPSVVASGGDTTSSGLSPKLALSYQAGPTSMLYASVARGFRQGNPQLNPDLLGGAQELAEHGQTGASYVKVKPDLLWSYEAGGKFDLMGSRLHLMTAVFHVDIKDFQQQMLLKSIGLVQQGNAGAAVIDGLEAELTGNLSRDLFLRLGLGYEDARITRPGTTFQAAGAPVYQVPRWTATLGGEYSALLAASLRGTLAASASYTGSSVSGNNGTDLTRPGYTLADLRMGISWRSSSLFLGLRNATNAKPNLGDLTYIGYGLFTDASRTVPIPQAVTLPPRTVTLQFTGRF